MRARIVGRMESSSESSDEVGVGNGSSMKTGLKVIVKIWEKTNVLIREGDRRGTLYITVIGRVANEFVMGVVLLRGAAEG